MIDAAKYGILFSLSLKDEWKVPNIIVNGINLGLTYRNQFNELRKKNGNNPDVVIKGWIEVSIDETAP